jgi:hypothetical protein
MDHAYLLYSRTKRWFNSIQLLYKPMWLLAPPLGGTNMITKEQRIEAMKGVLASLFASQRTLKSLAPNFKWAGLGNLLGDYGEFIAIEVYNPEASAKRRERVRRYFS